jgi:hypothetical protein
MRTHFVEEVERGDLLGAGQAVAIVDGVERHARVEGKRSETALGACKARVPGLCLVDQRLQQMGAAAARLAPDIERAISHGSGCERTFQPAQPRDQLCVGAGEKVVECRGRRGAEIERQLTKHSSRNR